MEQDPTYTLASDSGSELSGISEENSPSLQNVSLGDRENDFDSEGSRSSDEENEVASNEMRGSRSRTGRPGPGQIRGRGTNEQLFQWDEYPDEDPFEQSWLKDFDVESEGMSQEFLELSAGEKAVEYFKLFFPVEVVESMVTETNRYAHQVLDGQGDTYRKDQWFDTTEDEMRAFIGLQICMGLYPQCSIVNQWSPTFIYENKFGEVMGRNRYQYLNGFLHFSDNTGRIARGQPGYDPISKVKPLIDETKNLYKSIYSPGRDI
ncbi:piggyBac transposable element-derived protein 4-like [Aplysia californica]|uniref:PiggyBac transposable element-derived protein 4-like n=1 Tax=Aplysia californica TaxID=6500 RepID=A0ABM0ZYF7_APLCA|nr:piggyBac transposable element-derived protein 4-like [Aplysia californica]